MPLLDKDEILVSYASSQEDLLIYASNANMASNVAKALGTEAAITAGVAAVGAGVGAASATGTALGGAAAALGLSGPPGWIILGAALLVGGLGYALYAGLSQTDDNIEDLISRLDDLDLDDTHPVKAQWIPTLRGYKAALQMPGLADPQERVKQNMEQLLRMEELNNVLTQMQQDWPRVKADSKDWKWTGSWGDLGEAEVALNQTAAAMQQTWKQMQASADAAVKKAVTKLQQESGSDYASLANSILDLHKRLTDAGGKEPVYNNAWEQAGFTLAQNLVNKPRAVNMDKIQENYSNMLKLKLLMEQGLDHLKNKKTESEPKKKSSNKPLISKRALILGDGTEMGKQKKEKGVAQKGKKKGGRIYNMTIAIQKAINHLMARYMPQADRIAVDGKYGPQTAKHLGALMFEVPKLHDAIVDRAGVSIRSVQEPGTVRRDPNIIPAIYSVMSPVLEQVMSAGGAGVAGREERPQRGDRGISRRDRMIGRCPAYSDDLSAEDIDACLQNMPVVYKEERMSAYDFLRLYGGMGTSEQRARIVHDWRGTGAGGLPRPIDWMNSGRDLVEYVRDRFPRSRGKYPGIIP